MKGLRVNVSPFSFVMLDSVQHDPILTDLLPRKISSIGVFASPILLSRTCRHFGPILLRPIRFAWLRPLADLPNVARTQNTGILSGTGSSHFHLVREDAKLQPYLLRFRPRLLVKVIRNKDAQVFRHSGISLVWAVNSDAHERYSVGKLQLCTSAVCMQYSDSMFSAFLVTKRWQQLGRTAAPRKSRRRATSDASMIRSTVLGTGDQYCNFVGSYAVCAKISEVWYQPNFSITQNSGYAQ